MASLDKNLTVVKTERWKVFAGIAVVILLAYLLLVHWWFTAPMMGMGEQINQLRDQELLHRMEVGPAPSS